MVYLRLIEAEIERMTMRNIFLWSMVIGFFGLGLIDCLHHNWKTGVASLLLGIVQILIFIKGS